MSAVLLDGKALSARMRERLRQELGREPSLSELSDQTGWTPEEIAQVDLATEAPDSLQRETADGLALEGLLGTEAPEEGLVERIALREAVDGLSRESPRLAALRDAFARLLDQSENYVEYNLRQLQSGYDLTDPLQKAEFARAGAELLASLDSPVEREVYAGQLSEMTGVGKAALLQEIQRVQDQRLRAAKKKQTRRNLTPVAQIQPKARQLRYENPRSARAEEGILRLLMLDGSLVKQTQGLEPGQFSAPVLGKIYQVLLEHLKQGRPLQLGTLEGELEGEEIALLADILGQPTALENGAKAGSPVPLRLLRLALLSD